MDKMFTIKDISGQNNEISSYAGQFLPYAQRRLGFNKPVGVNFISDPENAKNPLGKTAYYDPNKMEITIFVDKRHVKDILRSLSHELVHHSQNCRGDFDSGVSTEPGYAQKDPHMRKMEAEAYLLGNGFLFRDWEDQLKQKKENITMSEGYKKKKSRKNLEENLHWTHPEAAPEHQEYAYREVPPDMVQHVYGRKDSPLGPGEDDHDPLLGGMTDPEAEMSLDPVDSWELEEGKGHPGQTCDEAHEGKEHSLWESEDLEEDVIEESWRKGNKDRLMFETLMKKWCK